MLLSAHSPQLQRDEISRPPRCPFDLGLDPPRPTTILSGRSSNVGQRGFHTNPPTIPVLPRLPNVAPDEHWISSGGDVMRMTSRRCVSGSPLGTTPTAL